jgi:hypothetical protein
MRNSSTCKPPFVPRSGSPALSSSPFPRPHSLSSLLSLVHSQSIHSFLLLLLLALAPLLDPCGLRALAPNKIEGTTPPLRLNFPPDETAYRTVFHTPHNIECNFGPRLDTFANENCCVRQRAHAPRCHETRGGRVKKVLALQHRVSITPSMMLPRYTCALSCSAPRPFAHVLSSYTGATLHWHLDCLFCPSVFIPFSFSLPFPCSACCDVALEPMAGCQQAYTGLAMRINVFLHVH